MIPHMNFALVTKKNIVYLILLFAIGALFFWQPLTVVSQISKPDNNPRHIRKVFNQSRIGQSIDVPMGSISGIRLEWNKKSLPKDTPIVLTLKESPYATQNILKINTTIADTASDVSINFRFKPINRTTIFFTLETPTLSEQDYLPLRYQIDSTKYARGQTFINEKSTYGDIAFTVFSTPPLIFLVAKYILERPAAGMAIVLFLISLLTWRLAPKIERLSTDRLFNAHKEWRQIAFIFIFVIFSFAPFLNMHFRQDDFVILDRVRTLLSENPFELLTNRGFVEASRSELPVHIAFYRPIANTVIPTVLYAIFKLNAWPHYFFNFLMHAVNAVGVYLIFRHFANKNISLIASALWATHSAVFVTVIWLSSIQEVLSAFFFIYSLLAMSAFWIKRNRLYWISSICLYIFAILAKENSFLFLAVAPLLILAIDKTKTPNRLRDILYFSTPYLFFSGIVLLIRSWMLSDPRLHTALLDTSYQISINPLVLLGNMSASLTWALQSWLFGFATKSAQISTYLSKIEDSGGWTSFPPVQILCLFFLAIFFLIIAFLRTKKNRGLRFALSFYIITSLPFLLLLNERQERWLYLPIAGLILAAGLALTSFPAIDTFLRKKIALIFALAVIAISAQWMTRHYSHISEARNQSSFTKQATSFLINNYPALPDSTEIVIANMPPDRKHNLGYAAIPLLYKNSSLKTSYPKDTPTQKEDHKVYLIFSESNNSLKTMTFE